MHATVYANQMFLTSVELEGSLLCCSSHVKLVKTLKPYVSFILILIIILILNVNFNTNY
jgi:hypothetical protein